MKVCILTPRFPFPENGGDVLRINNIARYLKTKGYKIILCSFYEEQISDDVENETKELYDVVYKVKRNKFISLIKAGFSFLLRRPLQCGFYSSMRYNKTFKKVIKSEEPDIYISHLIRMCPYLEKNKLQSKTIVEMTDALSKTYSLSTLSSGWSFKKFIYKFEKSLISDYEKKIIKTFPKVVLVSKKDIEFLGNDKNLAFYTNGIKCINDRTTDYNAKKISFVGNMRTLQNQDAVNSFIKDIFPKIKDNIPDVQFHIVGAEPPDNIKKLDDNDSIFVTGYVDSVEDYIKDSAILVAPVNIAAGIQNKVLIGMGCGIPVVMTSLISKAIPELINGENCFIEDDVDSFANICVEILKNSDLRNEIAKSGYQLMLDNYSWNVLLDNYEYIDKE